MTPVPGVNTPPTAMDSAVTTSENTNHTFAAAEFSYADIDGDALASVKITALPAAGTLTLDGTAIAVGALPKTVTAPDLTASKLKYIPPTDQIGTPSFTFKVNDGMADSPDEYTMTINVVAGNNPATGAPTISGTAQVGQTLTASTTPIDDLDGLPSVFTYQWMRVDADGMSNPANIGSNATSTTYTLTESEEGKKVKVEVSFTDSGGASEARVSAAYPSSGTVLQLTVSFGADAYTVAEGDTQSVTVTLSADPERTVVIPLTATNQGSTSPADYSVPLSVTFNTGELSQTITFRRRRTWTTTTTRACCSPSRRTCRRGCRERDGRDGGDHHRRRRPAGDGVVRGGRLHGPGGRDAGGDGQAERGPRAHGGHSPHGDEPGHASPADYSVPLSVTFNTGELSKTITFTAATDTDDDDDESVLLAFATNLPAGVSASGTVETVVTITDDDDPQVTVMFETDEYTVAEGDTVDVTVTLSADPERTVVIPLTVATGQGADTDDYSVPISVTFTANEQSKTIAFSATDGHGGRRRRERAARLRHAAADRRERGDAGHDRGEHHRRRRPAGDGVVRGGGLHGAGGRHGHGDGKAERGP